MTGVVVVGAGFLVGVTTSALDEEEKEDEEEEEEDDVEDGEDWDSDEALLTGTRFRELNTLLGEATTVVFGVLAGFVGEAEASNALLTTTVRSLGFLTSLLELMASTAGLVSPPDDDDDDGGVAATATLAASPTT